MGIGTFNEARPDAETDIAIIGAGMAGLYCALRLAEERPDAKITIVERLNRFGGRLQTDLVEISEGQVVKEEEGGMRFNYGMAELMNLNKKLGLCDDIVPFPMSSEGDSNRWHVRGQSFTVAEANAGNNKIWGELFDLNETERGRSPSQLVHEAFARVAAANNDTVTGNRTPEEWTQVREEWTWGGQTLNEWQLFGLLRDMGHSEEGIELMSSLYGFVGLFKGPTNAGDAFQVLGDFPKNPQLYTFRKGFSTLPDAIVQALPDDQVQLHLSTNVDSIDRDGDDFVLSLTEAPDHQNSNPFIPGGESKTLRAGQLVVAAATTGMERLFQTSPALNSGPDAHTLWENIHASRGMALMKINLYFESPWWEVEDGDVQPPVQYGPSFTSMPINSVYPFYSLAGPDSDHIPDKAAALTIYCDFNNTNFWAGLQNLKPLFTSELQEKQTNKPHQTMFAASQPVVDEILSQLKILFSVSTIPDPVLTSYRLWNGTDDFEHAYHQWRLGVVDSEVRTYLANPSNGLFFCNEAISDMQGWVNGSLRSANNVLAHFNIGPLDDDPCVAAPQSDTSPAPARVPGLWS